MARTLEGHLDAKGLRFALVAARWNEAVVARLLAGAQDALSRHGADAESVTVVRVPGSWEVALASGKLARGGKHDAIVALGALVRGQTPHFDVLATATARGLFDAAATSGTPVIFGVLTCDTIDQAMERSGGRSGNKGWDAALAAIEMASLYRRLD